MFSFLIFFSYLYDSPQPPFAFCLLSKKATARRMEASSSFTPPARRASTPNLCAGMCVGGLSRSGGGGRGSRDCESMHASTESVCGCGGGHALEGGESRCVCVWGGSRVWHASPLAAFARTRKHTRTHTRTHAPTASTTACTCMRQQRAARPHPQVD
jgi:hypothetical protein